MISSYSSLIGMERRRAPQALNTALPMAGATAHMGVSPAPNEGWSFLLMSTASIAGASLNRGTR
jgi:hypothetical protein